MFYCFVLGSCVHHTSVRPDYGMADPNVIYVKETDTYYAYATNGANNVRVVSKQNG